jgi:hypothetical protein
MDDLNKYAEAFENMIKFESVDKNQIEEHNEEEKKEPKKRKLTQRQIFYLR